MTATRTRIVGNGFTIFHWQGKTVTWLDSFSDDPPKPVSQPDVVFPIGSKHPEEIVVNRALGAGTLSLQIREQWDAPVWYQLGAPFEGKPSLYEVFEAMSAYPDPITASMIIMPPGQVALRGKTYHNVTVTAINEAENVTQIALTNPRSITAMYTHFTELRVDRSALGL